MRDNRQGTKRLLAALGLVTVAALAAMPTAGRSLAEPPLAASSNVRLVDHIPGTAAGMNFKDHYAYVSGWGGITVLDIANPAAPRLVGTLPPPPLQEQDGGLWG